MFENYEKYSARWVYLSIMSIIEIAILVLSIK